MKLRKLKLCDAPYMLEWMHELDVVKYMHVNFIDKTIADCETFISVAQDTSNNLHLAVVDNNDTYMGTVSLKNINDGYAEFAIIIRSSAMGKGVSKYAMSEIIRIGFCKLGLKSIYWSVNSDNLRALRFYEKNGYKKISSDHLPVQSHDKDIINSLIWYEVKAF